MAVDTLRVRCEAAGQKVQFQLFERYDLDDDAQNVSYASLAQEFGLRQATVNNYLAAARRDFRRIVLEKLREIRLRTKSFAMKRAAYSESR